MVYSSYKKYFFSEPYPEEMLVFIHFLKGKASRKFPFQTPIPRPALISTSISTFLANSR
jgi:hypothetical protein